MNVYILQPEETVQFDWLQLTGEEAVFQTS